MLCYLQKAFVRIIFWITQQFYQAVVLFSLI